MKRVLAVLLIGLVVPFVLASCAPPDAGIVADSADKSATATPRPTDTTLPESTKSATKTQLPTQKGKKSMAPPTNTATPLPQIAPTLPPTTEIK